MLWIGWLRKAVLSGFANPISLQIGKYFNKWNLPRLRYTCRSRSLYTSFRYKQDSSSNSSNIRQNYSEECEALVNKQINSELFASHYYLSMSSFFTRHDQALPGFAKFFKEYSAEERDHATLAIDYQHSRGGRAVLGKIATPPTEWGSVLEALETALEMMKQNNQTMLDIQAVAEKKGDPHLANFMVKYLEGQVDEIRRLGELVTGIKRVGEGFGTQVMDRNIEMEDNCKINNCF